MPSVFLSPSTQEYNQYVTGNSEEFYMNLIADAMEPYLAASGITYARNDPELTVGGSVQLANADDYDVHLALHSNASPPELSGQIQGSDVYFYQGSAAGEALAQLIVANLRSVYPHPELVNIAPNRALYELIHSIAPTVLVEIAYHDNVEDAQWIVNHIDSIARALALSLTQYFGIPFVLPNTVQRGRVDTEGFDIFLRTQPYFSAQTIGTVPNGADVMITGENGEWYVVNDNGLIGYIPKMYVTLL